MRRGLLWVLLPCAAAACQLVLPLHEDQGEREDGAVEAGMADGSQGDAGDAFMASDVSDASDGSDASDAATRGVTVVQYGFRNGVTAPYTAAEAAGDMNIVVAEVYPIEAGPIMNITDTAANIYARRFGPVTSGLAGNTQWEIWSSDAIAAHPPGVVVNVAYTTAAAVGGSSTWVLEAHATAGALSFDTGTSASTPDAMTASTGSITLRDSHALLVAFTNPSGAGPDAPMPPWIDLGVAGTASDAIYQLVTKSGAYSATFKSSSGASNWIAGVVSFGDGLGM